jgi:hypothetical protein
LLTTLVHLLFTWSCRPHLHLLLWGGMEPRQLWATQLLLLLLLLLLSCMDLKLWLLLRGWYLQVLLLG